MSTVNQDKKTGGQESTTGRNPSMSNPQGTGANRGASGQSGQFGQSGQTDKDKGEWTQATEKARDAANCATEMATHAASAVGQMATKTASDLGQMATKTAGDIGKTADQWTSNAGHTISEFGETIEKNLPHEGYLGSASKCVADTVKGAGHYLEESKLSGIGNDLAAVIRRNPIPACCLALGLGWLVASRMRS